MEKYMYRYRVCLLVNEFKWSNKDISKNQLITLFKPEQTLGKNLGNVFSNFSGLRDEEKVYASTIADDLFMIEEILELMSLFVARKDIQIMIYGSVKIPYLYDKKSCGISVIPSDRKTRYISFEDSDKLSFPLSGYVRWGRQLVDKEDQI